MAGPWDDYAPAKEPAAPAPAKKSSWDKKKPLKTLTAQERKDSLAALRQSDAVMNAELKGMSAPQRKKALATYYANPTIQRLRQEAGLTAVRTRDEELASIARKKFRDESTQPMKIVDRSQGDDRSWFRKLTDRRRKATPEEIAAAKGAKPGDTVRVDNQMGLEQSYINAFGRMLFGVPERVIAAFEGNSDGTKNYGERLKVRRQVTDMQRDRNIVGNVGGTIGGAATSSAGAAGALRLAGRGVAALPGGQAVGNFIQNLTRLQEGQKAGNAARIVAAGAGGGGTQALGEGSDVTTGTVTGAVAAPLTVAGFKGIEWASRPVRDLLRASGATGILRRFTSATREEITDAMNAFRQRTGREPTVFEVLPAQDRQAVEGLLKKMPGRPRERATELVRERVRAMPDEMAGRTAEITAPQQRFMARDLARELAESRAPGATPTPEELALARQAVTNPTRMEEVRNTINGNIMRPHDDTVVVQSIDELVPTAPQNVNGRIVQVESDPDISAMIRRAAGTMRLSNNGVTGANVTNLRAALQDIADRGGNEGLIARSAIAHLDDVVAREAPDIADAATRMRAANTTNKTRMQSEAEGRKTRVQEDIPVDSRLAGWRSDAAYETAEGAAGRAAGQRASLMRDFEGTPGQAIGRANEIAEAPGVQNAIRGNLGAGAGDEVADMAGAQSESFRRLSRLRQPQAGENQDMDFGDLAMSMSLLSPTSLVRTKSQAVGTLLRVFAGIPEGRATQIVNALFSREPEQIARALRMLDSAGERGQRALRDIVASVAVGSQAGEMVNNVDESREAAEPDIPAVPEELRNAPQPKIPGNLPLGIQFEVQNADGSISTVRTISIGTDQGEVLIPTVVNGRVVSDEEAIAHYNQTGEHFGIFNSPEEATAYAEALHNYHARNLPSGDVSAEAGPWDAYAGEEAENPVPYGRAVIEALFPGVVVTDDERDPNSPLGRANPGSYHNSTDGAVDVRPIPGMTFEEFIATIQDQGYEIVEAIDEVNNPSGHATGPHWHVVLA